MTIDINRVLGYLVITVVDIRAPGEHADENERRDDRPGGFGRQSRLGSETAINPEFDSRYFIREE